MLHGGAVLVPTEIVGESGVHNRLLDTCRSTLLTIFKPRLTFHSKSSAVVAHVLKQRAHGVVAFVVWGEMQLLRVDLGKELLNKRAHTNTRIPGNRKHKNWSRNGDIKKQLGSVYASALV